MLFILKLPVHICGKWHLSLVCHPYTEGLMTEVLQRGIGVQSPQEREGCPIYRIVFHPQAPIESRLRVHGLPQPQRIS